MGERGLCTLEWEPHTLADAATLATTHSLTKKFLGRPGSASLMGLRWLPVPIGVQVP